MNDLLKRTEEVAGRLLPALFAEMNSTGHAGHCILVSRVVDLVFKELGVPSEPLCVDYQFANAAAVRQMAQGRDLEPPAMVGQTGSGAFEGYDHHVVTLVRDDTMALFLDPAIIQIERHMPSVSIPPVMVTLPWPQDAPLALDVGEGRLTYSFRPEQKDFMDNEQWTDVVKARARAMAVLQRMEH